MGDSKYELSTINMLYCLKNCHITPLQFPQRPTLHNGEFLLYPKRPLWRGSTVFNNCRNDYSPAVIISSQISTFPLSTAKWSAVVRFKDFAVRFAPRASSISQRDRSPLEHAPRNGVIPAELALFTFVRGSFRRRHAISSYPFRAANRRGVAFSLSGTLVSAPFSSKAWTASVFLCLKKGISVYQ